MLTRRGTQSWGLVRFVPVFRRHSDGNRGQMIRPAAQHKPERAEGDSLTVTLSPFGINVSDTAVTGRDSKAPLRYTAAAAADGAVAGSGVRGVLTSADTDVMCRANSSGTTAVGISASGSSVIGAPDGVTWSSSYFRRVRPRHRHHRRKRASPAIPATDQHHGLRRPTRLSGASHRAGPRRRTVETNTSRQGG